MAGEYRKTLLFACGNILRGDDGVAWHVAELLLGSPPFHQANVVFTQQLLPEHAEALRRTELAIFLDCSTSGEPGSIATIPLFPARDLPHIFTHSLDPESLLRLTEHLYGRLPDLSFAVTITGICFELKSDLSKQVSASIPETVRAVRDLVAGVPPAPAIDRS